MADYFLINIPADGIIPWDFNAPLVPARPADTSAAMIAVNGLLLLAKQEQSVVPASQNGASHYLQAAIKVHLTLCHVRRESLNAILQILNDTTNTFWAPTWQSLLSNGTVNNPASPPNNLTGTIYGAYRPHKQSYFSI
jgi:hypothetical protein